MLTVLTTQTSEIVKQRVIIGILRIGKLRQIFFYF